MRLHRISSVRCGTSSIAQQGKSHARYHQITWMVTELPMATFSQLLNMFLSLQTARCLPSWHERAGSAQGEATQQLVDKRNVICSSSVWSVSTCESGLKNEQKCRSVTPFTLID